MFVYTTYGYSFCCCCVCVCTRQWNLRINKDTFLKTHFIEFPGKKFSICFLILLTSNIETEEKCFVLFLDSRTFSTQRKTLLFQMKMLSFSSVSDKKLCKSRKLCVFFYDYNNNIKKKKAYIKANPHTHIWFKLNGEIATRATILENEKKLIAFNVLEVKKNLKKSKD